MPEELRLNVRIDVPGGGRDAADWDRLPAILAAPEAVLLDKRKGGGRVLLFAFEPSDREGRKGKVVVRVEFSVRHRGRTRVSNSIRSSGYVKVANLSEAAHYEPLAGELE